MPITAVRLLVEASAESADCAYRWLISEFPSVELELAVDHRFGVPGTVALDRWLDHRNDFAPFDEIVDELAETDFATLVVRGPPDEVSRAAGEMLTRWQRHLGRRNLSSANLSFEAVLATLGSLHDLTKPLVRADWHHALDTWQWLLRIEPSARTAVQLAALLHDVERLESEADARIEHLAPSYEDFKGRHARRSAAIAHGVLASCGVDLGVAERTVELVAAHEERGEGSELAALNDADALSFFSQNSAGYLDYFGPAQTTRKITYTLGRMRPSAVDRLGTLRLRADVEELLARTQGSTAE